MLSFIFTMPILTKLRLRSLRKHYDVAYFILYIYYIGYGVIYVFVIANTTGQCGS